MKVWTFLQNEARAYSIQLYRPTAVLILLIFKTHEPQFSQEIDAAGSLAIAGIGIGLPGLLLLNKA